VFVTVLCPFWIFFFTISILTIILFFYMLLYLVLFYVVIVFCAAIVRNKLLITHFIFLSYCSILYHFLTCIYSLYLILPACKWLAPFAADV